MSREFLLLQRFRLQGARKRLESGKEDVVWFTAPETLEEEPEEDAGDIKSPFKFWHADPTADKQEIDDEMSIPAKFYLQILSQKTLWMTRAVQMLLKLG